MRARLILLAVVVVGAIGLWWLRPRPERVLTVEEAQKQVDFPVGVPKVLPAGTVLEGVKVVVPIRRTAADSDPRVIKRFKGLGMTLNKKNNMIFVGSVLNNSPAQKAGVHAGDQIVTIDGRSTAPLSFNEVLKMFRGQETVKIEVKNSNGQRILNLRQAEFDPRNQPDPPEPIVVFLYDRKGRKFILNQSKVKPGTTIRWAGTVLRKVNLNGVEATVRNINGHLTLTWTKENVEYELNSYQDGLSIEELISVAHSIKEGGKKQ